jgi:RimJ/RimL family protein N-acetyltransferase
MEAGRALLEAVKATAGGPGPALSLPVGTPPVALLRPVGTTAARIRAADVAALTSWRNRFLRSFLTEFEATEARTLAWLCGPVANDPGKILFLADAPDGRTFGYLGLDAIDWDLGSGEADAIVRGEAAPPGTMAAALRTLLLWAREGLGLGELWVRVLSDNRALRFYERCGFVERRRVPLRRIEAAPGETAWTEDPAATTAARSLVHLEWVPHAPRRSA